MTIGHTEKARLWAVGQWSRTSWLRTSPLVLSAAAAVAYVLRERSMLSRPFLIPPYAEDGAVFLKDAVERGGGAILEPYNGQLFVLQRLVAFFAAFFPVRFAVPLYMAAAIAIAVISCSIALSSRWRGGIPVGVRFVLVLALLCSPAVDETYATLASAHWWLAVGLVLVGMLYDPVSRRIKAGEIVFAAATALSGFAALYAIPTLAVRAVRNRSRHSLLLLGIASGGVVAQFGLLEASSRRGNIGTILSQPVADLVVLGRRVFGEAVLGDDNLAIHWPGQMPDTWVWIPVVALLAALAVIWVRAPRLEAGALIATLLGGWLLALWGFTLPGLKLSMLSIQMGASRYFLVPIGVIYVSLILTWPPNRLFQRVVLGCACLILAFGIYSDYHRDPDWSSDWPSFVACVQQSNTTCSTTIPPNWTLEISPPGR
jgi:hypothetical protein